MTPFVLVDWRWQKPAFHGLLCEVFDTPFFPQCQRRINNKLLRADQLIERVAAQLHRGTKERTC